MNKPSIYDLIRQKILILDGGLGTMIQGYGLTEEDYRGEKFRDWDIPLKGCNDLLVLTAPHVIERIHEAYLLAGADIISTDSFNANAISLADYGLSGSDYEINYRAARTARKIADEFTILNPHKPRYVAGSVGPTNRTASMSSDVTDPGARQITFDELSAAYYTQIKGLVDGGADLIINETFFDTLNVKASIFALKKIGKEKGRKIPVIISGTLADASGRTLSGQTVEAFYISVAHAEPLAVGFNCSFGARQLKPYLERLAAVSEFPVSVHPNAGLPNLSGGYDETPQMMAGEIESYLDKGLVNIIGGCCGTTPVHIGAFSRIASNYQLRIIPEKKHRTLISGLEPLLIDKTTNFVNIGERTNVAGSAKFARLIRENNLDEAAGIARQQVEAGAQIVDVCMDDGLIDGPVAMKNFLNLAASEPEIARVPFMIDSSSWETLEAGLKCTQGKSIVNSISLKEGEKAFLDKASLIRDYGAAAVVMLFDEKGQADTLERKIEIAQRAYDLLTCTRFPPEDIIFDPNVLAVATGIEEHNSYGIAFIEATQWIKENLPHAKVSGGVSNLSFSFHGNNKVREAMHSVFLYHAIRAGMDMGIVNPGMLQVYSEIDPELLELVEDVVLDRRKDAADRLAAYAEKIKNTGTQNNPGQDALLWRQQRLDERIAYAMKKGATDFIGEDIMEAYRLLGSPLEVIDRMLMPVMGEIGELFGEGKMFLPQVVKSARVMKKAVAVLTPFIEEGRGEASQAAKILIATVKGDVHDIGKNIVSVVMSCNGYSVKDLGVMVECKDIVESAIEWGADVIGLSGLISPSLEEMIKVVGELESRGARIPVIIGGATTSELHTAVKIALDYSGVVIQCRDASENVSVLGKLFGPERERFINSVKDRQRLLRETYQANLRREQKVSYTEAIANRKVKDAAQIVVPRQTAHIVLKDYPVAEVRKYIDWNFFFPAWEIKGKYPDILQSEEKGEEARKLFTDANFLLDRIAQEKLLTLNGVAGVYLAVSDYDDIVITGEDGKEYRLAQLRNQKRQHGGHNLSLADYVIDRSAGETDYICAFAVTAGIGLDKLTDSFRERSDDYNAIMCKLIADRLTEAFAEAMHSMIRRVVWGFETGAEPSVEEILSGKYQGVRMAFGYPACPDHSLKKEVFDLLRVTSSTGMSLTENFMIDPGEAICGLIFAGKDEKHFGIGRILADQLESYARRRGMKTEEIARLIPQHI